MNEYPELKAGDRVGEYVLIERVGEGGFGIVWKARHAEIQNRIVAIKFPKKAEFVELMKREANFQHNLNHPNIVRTLGLNLTHNPPFLVMEFAEGRNLRRLMQEEGIVPPPHAIDIAIQILDALAFAHSKGIVHKDIKPENICVSKQLISIGGKKQALFYKAKVMDFGLGMPQNRTDSNVVLSGNSRTSGIRLLSGTMFYMAPEQMSPHMKIDERADIYSLGVLLYEILTGELPFGMDLPSELNPVVPHYLDVVVKKALSIDPDQRYKSAREMQSALVGCRERLVKQISQLKMKDDAVSPSASVTYAEPVQRSALSLPTIAAVMAVFILFIAGALLIPFFSGNSPKSAPGQEVPEYFTINSDPSGCDVLIDGIMVGKTPYVVSNLAPGIHSIKVMKANFKTRNFVATVGDGSRVISITDEAGASLSGIIKMERESGQIELETPNVKEAKVYVNEVARGKTPFKERFQTGEYRIRIEAEGYEQFEQIVMVNANTTVSKTVFMKEKASATAPNIAQDPTVSIITQPSEAYVFIDDELRGISPVKVQLKPGTHNVRIVRKYFKDKEVAIKVDTGSNDRFLVDLIPKMCNLKVTSDPEGAAIYIDDKPVGQTPMTLTIAAGEHLVGVKHPGFGDVFTKMDISEDTTKDFQLRKLPPSTIAINCEIKDANIYIDGKFASTVEKQTQFQVPAGTHKIIVGGFERQVTSAAGETVNIYLSGEQMSLVTIPEGKFTYGGNRGNPWENPLNIEFTRSYIIGKYEISNAMYSVFTNFMNETNDHSRCHPSEPESKKQSNHRPRFWDDENFRKPDYPVCGIDFYDAYAYAAFCGGRLPTEYEWEKAARGDKDIRSYPWGDEWKPNACNHGERAVREDQDAYEILAPVNSFLEFSSPFGCLNMSGNVAEWCNSMFDTSTDMRVVKGGHFNDGRNLLRIGSRNGQRPTEFSKYIGFRIVYDK